MSSKTFLFILILLSIGPPMSCDIHQATLPDIATSLQASNSIVKLATTLLIFGYCTTIILYGPLSDYFGRRPVLLVGLAIYSIATFVCAIAPNITLFLSFRFIQGMGASSGPVIAYAMTRDYYHEKQRAKYIALITASVGVAISISPILGSYLGSFISWRANFWLLLIVALISIFYCLKSLKETNTFIKVNSLLGSYRGYISVLKSPLFLMYTAMAAFSFAGYFAYVTASSFVYIEGYRVSSHVFGFLFALNAVSYCLGSLFASRWVEYLGLDRFLALGAFFSFTGSLLLLFTSLFFVEFLSLIVIGMLITTLGVTLLRSMCMSKILAPFEKLAGGASSLFNFSIYLVGTLASFLASLFQSQTPLNMAIIIAVCGGLTFLSFCLSKTLFHSKS
jgi:DHA1 family bicyclomycin/chloramphenicol resistance-like MFS transporter